MSNSICTPVWAVVVVASYFEATSITSPPMTSSPASLRRSSIAARVISPLTSGVPVPGANTGSRQSTSKET